MEMELASRKQELGWKIKNNVNNLTRLAYKSSDLLSPYQNERLRAILDELDQISEDILGEVRNS